MDYPSCYARVLSRLRGLKQSGSGKWVALCPAHNDHNPSLSIAIGTSGKLLLACMANCKCSTEAIVRALGCNMAGLFPDNQKPRPKIVKVYSYFGRDGQLSYQTVRYFPKDFKQRRPNPDYNPNEPDGDGNQPFIWNLEGVERVPYRLSELLLAIQKDKRVVIAEGEKDADALWEIGVAATTNACGAGHWEARWNEHLKGCCVAVTEDNNQSGRERCAFIAKSLAGIAAKVKVVTFRDMPDAADVSDWLKTKEKPTAGDWWAMVKSMPDYKPDPSFADMVSGMDEESGDYPIASRREGLAQLEEYVDAYKALVRSNSRDSHEVRVALARICSFSKELAEIG